MKKYNCTSPKLDGYITLEFNEHNLLCAFELRAKVDVQKHLWLLGALPHTHNELETFKKQSGLTITEEVVEITFDVFYSRYNVKEGRLKAEKAWKALPKGEQVKAFRYITAFQQKCAANKTGIPYPATYLNNQRWND